MSFRQISDVVKWSADFHAELGCEYIKLSEATDAPRIQEVLRYLANHEQEIERGLRDHMKGAEPALVGGWVRGEVSPGNLKKLQELSGNMDASTVDAVMERAVDIHKALEGMYGELVSFAELAESRELLKNLCEHEDAEARRMVRDIGWYGDI